ncbi:hypothetical protein SmJEL517_g01170 [Synchytrium microbalum]|uniref:Aquaporin n=1 Tax=Synchytrium microbalum TaxID=1806994 RepID=A0A507CG82_9FUNG|nr:uncharacterized protein SmJEL517_g01170 [Synchytrium microbalum]TPX36605.1 hypothetical protein SmJEL517_g01170 [Synchytrium microbalum]
MPSLRHDILCTIDEFFATTIFLFGAYGAIRAGITGAGELTNDSLIVIAFGFGFSLMTAVWVAASTSGACCNPVIAMVAYLAGKLSVLRLILYILAESLAAIFAAALVKALMPGDFIGATTPGFGSSLAQAWFLEMVMSAVLALVVLNGAIDGQSKELAPLHIGLTLVVIHLGAVPFSGSSVNPARSLGSAVLSGVWTGHWIYWTAPFVGGLIGFVIWKLLQKGRAEPDNEYLAAAVEFIGTAMFLFLAYAGIQAAVQTSAGTFASTLLVIALAFGISLMITVWTFGGVTGAPQNPAVAISVFLIGKMSLTRMLLYIVTELAGGLFAGGLAYAIFPNKVVGATTLGDGTTQVQGVFLEAITTSFLLVVILRDAVSGFAGIFAPIPIGFVLIAIHLVTVQFTGASVNIARSLGTAVITAVGVWKVAAMTDAEAAAEAKAAASPTTTLVDDGPTVVKVEGGDKIEQA